MPPAAKVSQIAMADVDSQIDLVNADGTNQTALASGISVSWSPDGSALVFDAECPQAECIAVMAAGSVTQFTGADSVYDILPVWSTDGTKIAFESATKKCFLVFCSQENDVSVMTADGHNLKRLAQGYSPAWSPDSQRLAFIGLDRQGVGHLYAVQADGSGLRQLSSTPAGFVYRPAWSPDGKRIGFADTADAAYILNVDSGAVEQFPITFGSPAWSPDGTQVAMARGSDTPERQVYVGKADGTDLRPITNEAVNVVEPIWSPDSSRIAYLEPLDSLSNLSHLCAVARDGSGEQCFSPYIQLIQEHSAKIGHTSRFAWRP